MESRMIEQPLKRKRYSLKGDLDDLAFDIFCFDEMPAIRQEFDSKNKLDDDALNEAILDELIRRWRHLSANMKDEYLSKAVAESSKKKISYCRCWKSTKFPLCDGEHKCHNRENDDNVGPLNLVWRDDTDNEKSAAVGSADTTSKSPPPINDPDMDIKSIDSLESDQPTLGGGSGSAAGSNGSDDFDDQLVKIDGSPSNNNNDSTPARSSSNVDGDNNGNNNRNLTDEQLSSLEMIDDDNNFTTFNSDSQHR
ncbi:hypothetical protein BLA29_006235 [Euroglyphus maynei]|uniref:CDGSH iron-sulfur domain-containing protein 2 homologue n=1 Tax=Euroglyphus maynei TaxID=6958 RepID=A0A1Y3BHB3_EURMA|nr:hypothetical protein BLA29_006235 [Euroglyphus maynei]